MNKEPTSDKHKIYYYEQLKDAISTFDDKTWIEDSGKKLDLGVIKVNLHHHSYLSLFSHCYKLV